MKDHNIKKQQFCHEVQKVITPTETFKNISAAYRDAMKYISAVI